MYFKGQLHLAICKQCKFLPTLLSHRPVKSRSLGMRPVKCAFQSSPGKRDAPSGLKHYCKDSIPWRWSRPVLQAHRNISSHLSPVLPFVYTSLGTYYDLKTYSTLLWRGLIPQVILNPYIGYNTIEFGHLRPVLGSQYFIYFFCSFSLSSLFH